MKLGSFCTDFLLSGLKLWLKWSFRSLRMVLNDRNAFPLTVHLLLFNILSEEIKPSVMIVEEAAEILEGQLVAAIPPSVQHLIMIGDHQQLKPVVQNPRLRKTNNLDVSMFERLVNCKIPFKQLEYQCRMRDDIVDLLRTLKIYKELKTKTEVNAGKYGPKWTMAFAQSLSKGRLLLFAGGGHLFASACPAEARRESALLGVKNIILCVTYVNDSLCLLTLLPNPFPPC